MKTYIIKSIFWGLLLLFSSSSFAASPEAEFRKLSEIWTLHSDGSQEYHYSKELTLFTHTAMNSTYGQTFITYDPDFQELKIHKAYVKQKDGKIVQTPPNAFVEVLPSNAADAPAYNRLKEMVIVHTGLELGATIYLDYSLLSKPGYLPQIDVYKYLEETSPIKEYTLTFNLPESVRPSYRLFQLKNQPVKSVREGMQQLKWTFRNLPAQTRERGSSLQNGDIAGLLFTTYPSTLSALQTLYRQFDSSSSQLTALAQQLTQSCQYPYEKIYNIQRYIQTDLATCSLSLPQTGFRLRPATQVISTAYGTRAEKVNLMTALLKASGIEAVPAAAYYLPTEPESCGLNAITELIVLVNANNKTYRLSVDHMQPAAADANFLVDLAEGKKWLPDTSKASIDYQVAVVITPELNTQTDVTATFSNRFISYTPDYVNRLVPGIGQPNVSPQAETTTISGKYAGNLTKEQQYLLLYLPTNYSGINSQSYAYYNSNRKKNVRLPALVEETYAYDIQVPENLTLCTPDQETKIENKAGSLKITVTSQGSSIHVNQVLRIDKCLVTPAEYSDFRKLVTVWAERKGKPLLFKPTK